MERRNKKRAQKIRFDLFIFFNLRKIIPFFGLGVHRIHVVKSIRTDFLRLTNQFLAVQNVGVVEKRRER
jgi:hypothetical protein